MHKMQHEVLKADKYNIYDKTIQTGENRVKSN